MKGDDFIEALSRHFSKKKSGRLLNDSEIAREIGLSSAAICQWRGKDITPRQIISVISKLENRAERKTEKEILSNSLRTIVEFLNIDRTESKQGKRWEIFSSSIENNKVNNLYLVGIKERLKNSKGIYIFHDSRGRAIYVGKSIRQSLWDEINNAFNRDRGEVQSITKVDHPSNSKKYDQNTNKNLKIKSGSVALHDIATYLSVYEVCSPLISKLEALIIRSFANDLLNVRMENI